MYEDYNAHDYGLAYQVPVYYMIGDNDWQTAHPLAKEYFDEITAPEKIYFSIPLAQ